MRFAPQPQALTLTFGDLYATSDTYGGDYREVMDYFTPTPGAPNQWDAPHKLDSLVGIEETPNAYIGIFENGAQPEGRVRLLHCPSRYTGILGNPSPLNGEIFAVLDDIVGAVATFVYFPDDAMELCAVTRIPATFADATAAWNNEPNAILLDPVAAPNGREVQVPHLMHVPAEYIPFFMGRQLTPRQLAAEVLPVIEGDGRAGQMQTFVDWCMIAGTATAAGGDHSRLVRPALRAPVADAPFLNWTRRTINRFLPDVATASTNATTLATTRIANIMTDVLTEQRASRQDAQDARERATSPRSVSEFFKEHGTVKLLSLTQVDSEEQLPEIWSQVASATNKREREAIETIFRQVANALGIPELCPVVTPNLAKKITSLRLAGTNLQDLEEGVHPFTMVIMDHSTDSGEQAYQAAIEATRDYDDMMAGGGHADLNDLRAIKNSKVLLPETFELARAMLQAYKVTLIAILGEAHPVVLEYNRFLTTYTNRESFYVGCLRRTDLALGPARLLRYVQLAMRAWFQGVWEAPTTNAAGLIRTPPLYDVLDKMMMGDVSWLPTMPDRYIRAKTPAGSPTPDKDTSRTKASQVINRHRDSRFDDFKTGIQKTKFNDAIRHAGTAPPNVTRNGGEVPLCASYHLRGTCFSNCSRRATHDKISAAESDSLYDWCKLAFE